MSIYNIRLSFKPKAYSCAYNLLDNYYETGAYSSDMCIHDGYSYSEIYVIWETDYGLDDGKSTIYVSANWRTAALGGGVSHNDAFGDFLYTDTECIYGSFTPSECYKGTSYKGRHIWSVPLSKLTTRYVSTTVSSVFSQLFGSSADFPNRKYDGIDLHLQVRMSLTYDVDDVRSSDAMRVWFVPNYSVENVYVSSNGNLVISYSVSSSWTRVLDRWEVNNITYGSTAIYGYGTSEKALYGTVEKIGSIVIPLSRLSRLPNVGETVTFGLRIVGALAPVGTTWGSLSGTTKVKDSTCGPVTGTIEFDSDSPYPTIRVTNISALSSTLSAPNSYVAKLYVSSDTDKARACYSPGAYDSYTSSQLSEDAYFYFPPLGEYVSVQLFGAYIDGDSGEEAISSCTTLGPVYIPNRDKKGFYWTLVQNAENPIECLPARFNLERSLSGSRDSETVQLNGRRRPSVYFDSGSEVTHSLTFDIWQNESPSTYALGTWYSDYDDDGTSDSFKNERFYGEAWFERKVKNLIESGVCVVRQPDGFRYAAVLTNVQSTFNRNPYYMSISVDATEVDYGD